MALANDYIGDLTAITKQVYGDDVKDLIPQINFLTKNISFGKREKLGSEYIQPVKTQHENGFTFAASDEDYYSLATANGTKTLTAKVNGYQTNLRAFFGIKQIAVALAKGKEAFIATTAFKMKDIVESSSKMLESHILYGQKPKATIDDYTAVSGNATIVLHVSTASWAPHMFAGREGMYVNLYNGSSIFGTAGVNPAYGTADFRITEVDYENEQITVSGDSTIIGNIITHLGTSGNTVDLYWRDSKSKEMYGLDYIVTNTGTIWNIDAGAYSYWRGNTKAVNGSLTADALIKSVYLAIGKGGLSEKAVALVAPDVYLYMCAEYTSKANVQIPFKMSKGDYGVETLNLMAGGIPLEVVSHGMVKRGDAFILPMKDMIRVGAHDLTFKIPGRNDEYWNVLNDVNGYEIRTWVDQAIFTPCPAKMTKLTGITVSL